MRKQSGSISHADEIHCQPSRVLLTRRQLLKFATMAAGAAMLPSFLPFSGQASTVVLGQRGTSVKIKGSSSGKIFVSHDNGISWSVGADFGPHCPVISLRPTASGVSAQVGHRGHSFTLSSVDGSQWIA